MAKKAKAVYEFLPIYARHLFFCNDVDAVKKLINQYYPANKVDVEHLEGANAMGFVSPLPCELDDGRVRAFVMYVRDEADIGTVTHEAVHLTNQIFSYISYVQEDDNDEVQAYLCGHIAQRFLETMRGHKPSKPKPLEKIKRKK